MKKNEEVIPMDKTEEVFGLFKIPDIALLKICRIEIDRLGMQILNLQKVLSEKNRIINDLNFKQKIILTPEEKIEIRKGELYETQKKTIIYTENKIKKLKKENRELLELLIKFNNEKSGANQ